MVGTQIPFLQTTLLRSSKQGFQNHLYKVLLAQASRKEQIVLICFDRKNMKELYWIWHNLRPKGRETKASGGVHYLRRLHSASMANLGPATPNMGPT